MNYPDISAADYLDFYGIKKHTHKSHDDLSKDEKKKKADKHKARFNRIMAIIKKGRK